MKHIIRNTNEVEALLNGASQLRIPIKKDWIQSTKEPLKTHDGIWHFWCSGEHAAPFQIGDEVFVKETLKVNDINAREIEVLYKADNKEHIISTPLIYTEGADEWSSLGLNVKNTPNSILTFKSISNMCMPQSLSRFTLKITNVRVERLQDISGEDCKKEGMTFSPWYLEDAHKWFKEFWDSSTKDGFTFDDNPYVFVYDFEVVN